MAIKDVMVLNPRFAARTFAAAMGAIILMTPCRATAGCCYDQTVEWYVSGYVDLPGEYNSCSELIVSGNCWFDTYWYYCVDDCGDCSTECYDYGEWMLVAAAKETPCTLRTTMRHMEVCLLSWILNISEQGSEVYAKCLCPDD